MTKLKKFCEELGVCREEALLYLQGSRWDLNAAMEACRSNTLPSRDQPPSENKRAKKKIKARKNKMQRIGSSAGDAQDYPDSFVEDPDDNTQKKSKPLSRDIPTTPWHLLRFSESNEGSEVMTNAFGKDPLCHATSTNLGIQSPPSATTQSFEPKQESVKGLRNSLPEVSSQPVIDCLKHSRGNVADNKVDYLYGVYNKARPGIATKKCSGMAVDQDSNTESLQLVASSHVKCTEPSNHGESQTENPQLKKIKGEFQLVTRRGRLVRIRRLKIRKLKGFLASRQAKLVSVAAFLATASLKLWSPPGLMKADGLPESLNGISYRLLQIGLVTILIISVAAGFCLLKWKPSTRREKLKQTRVAEFIIWVGLIVFSLVYMAGYFSVSSPFNRGVLAVLVPILIGILTIALIGAGIKQLATSS